MPKVIRFHQTGNLESLQLEELATRAPAANEVKLRVQAVGLNRAELMYIAGTYYEQPLLPSRIGYEAAGTVIEVGPGVDKGWLGKSVATMPGFSMNHNGVLGEEAIVPEYSLGEYPSLLTPTQAAAIWMQYTTAYGALVMHGKLSPGDFVLITAASSSVGIAAIEICKAEGAISIATTRTSAKKAEILALGADHVLVSDEEDVALRVRDITGGKLARLVLDPIGGPFVEVLTKATATGGTVFEFGALSPEPTPFPLMEVMGRAIKFQGYMLKEVFEDSQRLAAARKYVQERLADGRFVPKIAATFPLERAREAYQYLASNQQVGKVVITI